MSRPGLRERLKPLELVGFAAVLGVFAGIVVMVATREPQLAAIFAGIAFIVGLLILAGLALAADEPRDPNGVPMLDRPRKEKRRR